MGQKIAENRIDDFTKHHVIRTDWEALSREGGFYTHIRVSSIDHIIFFDLKWLHDNEIGAINEGARIMFKMTNDSIVTLHTLEGVVSCRGCGAVGFAGSTGYGYQLSCSMGGQELSMLSKLPVKKMRIYLPDGYVEYDIKEKFSQVLMNQILLIGKTM